MIMNDPKKRITTILSARMMPSGSMETSEKPKNENGDEIDAEMGLQAAADEIVSAIQKSDSKQLKSALKSFISMCDDMEDSAEGSDSE